MNLIFTKNLVPGMCTSEDVTTGNGFIKLLSQGITLNESQINKLKNWGLSSVSIDTNTKKAKDARVAICMTKAEFIQGYDETINEIIHAFQYIKKFKEVPIAEMQELVDEKISLLIETMGVIEHLNDIRFYNKYTFHHSLHVAIIAGVLGRWCGYKQAALKNLILAGLLHDIGKLFVPLSILDKPDRLSDTEFAIIKKHPQDAYQLLKDTQLPEEIKLGIWQHHECLDGSGYPLGLTDAQICADAKIIAIADIYDSITSDRVYRPKMTPFEALDILADSMFKKLDPHVCLTFIDNMRNYFTGSSVILSNGAKAKIIAFSTKNISFTKPVIHLQNGKFLDLQKENLYITEIQAFS